MNHRFAHEANIARFRALLENEQDPGRRAMIEKLLSEEERRVDSGFVGPPQGARPGDDPGG